MHFDIDTTIFIGFLIVNLGIGLLYSGGINTLREYAVGTKSFSTATLTATIIATCIGGGFFSPAITESYRQGLYFIIPALGEPLALIITGYFLAPRMGEFLGNLSIAEAMGDLYGQHVRTIAAIGSIFLCIGMVALEFKVSATILKLFFDVDSFYAVLASAMIVILYSTFGGIKAVTFTDVVQFFTFGTIVPLISLAIWGSVGDPTKVFNLLNTNPLFSLSEVFDISNPRFISAALLMMFFLMPELQPVFFQRVIMAKNTAQAKRAFMVAGLITIALLLVVTWIGILLLADKPNMDPNTLLTYILANYSYPGLKGLTAIGIMAIIMSTTDSYINSAAVILSHDILNTSERKISFLPSEVMLPRLCAAFIGVSAFFLAFNASSILELIVQVLSFYMPIVSPALVLAIFGFRSTSTPVLIGMFAGLITVLAFIFAECEVDGVIPGVIANIACFISAHYLFRQPGGWVGIKDNRSLMEAKMMRRHKWRGRFVALREFNLIKFCQTNAPRSDHTYSFFGLFCIISVFSTMYSIPIEIQRQKAELFKLVYDTVLLSSTIFLTYPAWPATVKHEKFIILFWSFVGPYILVFAPVLLVIASGFGQFQMMILILNFVVLSTLLRWYVAIFMICSYIFLGAEFYSFFVHEPIGEMFASNIQFKVMYMLLLFSSVLIGFLKPQQEYTAFAEDKIHYLETESTFHKTEISHLLDMKNEFIRNIEHESRTPITGISSMAQVLEDGYDKFSDAQRKGAIHDIVQSSERLNSWATNLADLSRLTASGSVQLKREKINLSELVEERLNTCTKLYIDNSDTAQRSFSLNIGHNIIANCDRYYIGRVIDNLIINAIQYSKAGEIKLTLKQSAANIEFYIDDEGIGIPPEELHDIFGLLVVSSKSKNTAGGRGIGLALAKKIIELHGGTIWAESDGQKGARFVVVI